MTTTMTAKSDPGPFHQEPKRISVLQPWVETLGLRHQGVLLSCIRGCDSVPKEDASKLLARCLRGVVLVSFDTKPSRFIDQVDQREVARRMIAVLKNCDHYPVHYVAHLMHGAAIIGYKHPDQEVADQWRRFYIRLARGLHLFPETGYDLDARLNAEEEEFAERAKIDL